MADPFRVWIPHPTLAYAPARVLGPCSPQHQRSRHSTPITAGANYVEAEADDGYKFVADLNALPRVHKNSLYGVPNLLDLGDFSMPALLHNVRIRYQKEQYYCGIGLPILISVNPYKPMPHLYDATTRLQYQRCAFSNSNASTPGNSNTPSASGSAGIDFGGEDCVVDRRAFLAKPHLFATAQVTYSSLVRTKQAQSIVISGESGAGKTEATKILLRYFSELGNTTTTNKPGMSPKSENRNHSESCSNTMVMSSSLPSESIEQHTLKSNPVLEAFGNAKTLRNDNSSRFGKFIQIYFDIDDIRRVKSAKISHYLLERCRLVSLHKGERNFHIFYQLLLGGAQIPEWNKRLYEWKLHDASNFLRMLGHNTDDWTMGNETEMFIELIESLDIVGFHSDQIEELMSIVAGLLHLSSIEFMHDNTAGQRFTQNAAVRPISIEPFIMTAKLLGLTKTVPSPNQPDIRDPINGLVDVLLVKATWDAEKSGSWIRSHRDIEHAYQVRDSVIKEIYSRLFSWIVKKINDALANRNDSRISDSVKEDPVAFLDMIRRRGEELSRKTKTRTTLPPTNATQPIGLLDIYGFEVFEGRNSYEQLCINFANEKLQQHFNQHVLSLEQKTYQQENIDWSEIKFSDNQDVIRALEEAPCGVFVILDDTSRVAEKNRDARFMHQIATSAIKSVVSLPPKNQFKEDVFVVRHYAGEVEYNCEKFVEKNVDRLDIHSSHYLARTTTSSIMRQLFPLEEHTEPGSTRSNSLRCTVSIEFRNQLDRLLRSLTETTPTYVRCIKPNPDKMPRQFDSHEVLRQLNYAGLLESIRIRNSGFGVRCTFVDFLDDYACISPQQFRHYRKNRIDLTEKDLRQLCNGLLLACAPKPISSGGHQLWQLGRTRVFMKEDVQTILERARSTNRRLKALTIQRVWRGYRVRLMYRRFKIAVVKLQCFARRIIAMRYLTTLRIQRNGAAIQIQRIFRGWIVRKFLIPRLRGRLMQTINESQPLESHNRDLPSVRTHSPINMRIVEGTTSTTPVSTRESLGLNRPTIYGNNTQEEFIRQQQQRRDCSADSERSLRISKRSPHKTTRSSPHRNEDLEKTCRVLASQVAKENRERTFISRDLLAAQKQLRKQQSTIKKLEAVLSGFQHEFTLRERLIAELSQQRDDIMETLTKKHRLVMNMAGDYEGLLNDLADFHDSMIHQSSSCSLTRDCLSFIQGTCTSGRDACARFRDMYSHADSLPWEYVPEPRESSPTLWHRPVESSVPPSIAPSACHHSSGFMYPPARGGSYSAIDDPSAEESSSTRRAMIAESGAMLSSRGSRVWQPTPSQELLDTHPDGTWGVPPLAPPRRQSGRGGLINNEPASDLYMFNRGGDSDQLGYKNHARIRSVNGQELGGGDYMRSRRLHHHRPPSQFMSNHNWNASEMHRLNLQARGSSSRVNDTPVASQSNRSSNSSGKLDPFLVMGGKSLPSAGVQTSMRPSNTSIPSKFIQRSGVHSATKDEED